MQEKRTIIVAYLAFVGLGLTSGLLGLAWPSAQVEFGQSLDSVSIIFLLQTVGYTLAGFSIGRLMSRWGSGTILLVGVTGTTACMFGVAASASFVSLAGISLLGGLASGLVDAGLNLYLATYHAARQMSWLHASFGIGITLGPLVMTFVLEHHWRWQTGYAIVGTLLVSIVVMFVSTRRAWRSEGFGNLGNKPIRRAQFLETPKSPVVLWSMATFVIYVGMEIGIGQWAYVLLTETRAIAPSIAGPWTSAYWGAFTGGRILMGIVANRLRTDDILRAAMLIMIAGAFIFWWSPVDLISLLGLVVVGFAQAPVFPLLMSDTVDRVGAEHAENTIGLQMGAVGIGTAILPGLIGMIGEDYGLESLAAAFVLFSVLVLVAYELARMRIALPRATGPVS